jgi:TPR repeat protein
MGLAFCYLVGEGCEQNVKAAFHCFQKLSQMNNASAMFECGISYELGRGVTADLVEAHKYYNMAMTYGMRTGFTNAYMFATARLKLLQPLQPGDENAAFRMIAQLAQVLYHSFLASPNISQFIICLFVLLWLIATRCIRA